MLNLFFENINPKLELVLIGAFIFAIYWFILRKYNSLGLRLFVLCFLLFIGSSVWLYKDEMKLKRMIASGEEHVANVISKTKDSKHNEVTLSFITDRGQAVRSNSRDYISDAEWARLEPNGTVPVIYVASSEETFVKQSVLRFKQDKIYLYFFAGFWLILGTILYAWLRKYKVGVDAGGNEWVEKPDGKIILDERGNTAYRATKQANLLSKLFQSFGK